MFKLKHLLYFALVYILYSMFVAPEGFLNWNGTITTECDRHWWIPRVIKPWFKPVPDPLMASSHTDITLANLNRELHNTEAIARIDVFQDPIHLHGGSDDGIDKRFWLGEQLELKRMLLQKKIRDEIAFNRKPWSDAYNYNVPTTPLGGTFDQCVGVGEDGDCQIAMDYNEQILGIPSTLGTRHVYY